MKLRIKRWIDIAVKKSSEAKNSFLDLVFPIECLGCGQEGFWLCPDCEQSITINRKGECPACGLPADFGAYCQHCRKDFLVNGVWVATAYENSLTASLIKTYKYRFVKSLDEPLARLMAGRMDNIMAEAGKIKKGLSSADAPIGIYGLKNAVVVPVPLAVKRRNWRGFNQAEGLALRISENYGLDYDGRSLKRTSYNRPQTGLSRSDRQKNVQGCFAWQGGNLSGRTVILIDDVITTGSTLNECAKVLKQYNARQVWGLVAAKN